MSATGQKFSHVGNFTGYMEVVTRHFAGAGAGLRVLDLPAGNGKFADALRALGHQVVCADINRERPDYVYADMSAPLPFGDGEFDAVICLEGIEHLLDPVQLIAELVRVTRPGGEIVISTPNVLNWYSRLQFLFTGTFYQFAPGDVPPVAPGEQRDRGHVFPLSYFQLRYLFECAGARVKLISGDHWKRKVLMPVYLLLLPFAWWWSRALFLRNPEAAVEGRNRELLSHLFSGTLLFSRSLIVVFERVRPAQDDIRCTTAG
ncbi:MAG: class I SAM-dependent methyltransferase [Betaproteobacteria bacterium]|nr:class I SAM-dependent methyltransferase [Betaproteobacteria bacterium]